MTYWLAQVLRALSRLLNALMGGEGDVTFSAGSYDRGWTVVVALIDAVAGSGHCRAAWLWHQERRLLERDRAG